MERWSIYSVGKCGLSWAIGHPLSKCKCGLKASPLAKLWCVSWHLRPLITTLLKWWNPLPRQKPAETFHHHRAIESTGGENLTLAKPIPPNQGEGLKSLNLLEADDDQNTQVCIQSTQKTLISPHVTNSQSLEDTQVGYILQKYTLDSYTLERVHFAKIHFG